jgi:hypothetical protein
MPVFLSRRHPGGNYENLSLTMNYNTGAIWMGSRPDYNARLYCTLKLQAYNLRGSLGIVVKMTGFGAIPRQILKSHLRL